MSEFEYPGTELELFATALNWKTYWSSQIAPFLVGDILEVGAGIGANTLLLGQDDTTRWVCLEPNRPFLPQLEKNVKGVAATRDYEILCGTLRAVGTRQFDAILYIDVLEHIENDREELRAAGARLRPGGHLIVLSPAHQRLFTPFDAAIGHFRRYNRRMLQDVSPPGFIVKRMRYLDSTGIGTSVANLLFLRQSMPTKRQLQFWDRFLIPISTRVDRLLGYSVGKTILGVWQKPV